MLLEEACDLLHELMEKPLDPYLDQSDTDRSPFYRFKSHIVTLTNVTSVNYKAMTEQSEFVE